MILVVGATGTVGGATVRQLAAGGVRVRALCRTPEGAATLSDSGAETALGDLGDPRSLDAVLDGVTRALLVSPLAPRQVELQGNFVAAVRRAGRIHVVKLSGLATALHSTVRSGRWHAATERQIEEAGVPFTHLRPPFFMQNLVHHYPMSPGEAGELVLRAPMRDARIAMVDARDVAAVAVAALTGEGHAGQAYTVTGPEALSFAEVAETLTAVTGRRVVYRDEPAATRRTRSVAEGSAGWLADLGAEFAVVLSTGGAATVTDAVLRVTGRPPRSFAEFAREHRAAFHLS